MRPFMFARGRLEKLAAALLALPLIWPSAPASAATLEDLVLSPTPLILKDGRIAQVSVHTIPFDLKKAELDADALAAVRGLLVPFATDCFLTAQAIGHVQPGDPGDGDTLSAHRLARARADSIQSILIKLGLPASAVASVWDWQFMVEEPRVTLWVFRLHEEEDCEGKPVSEAAVASIDNESVSAPAATPAPQEVLRAEAKPAQTTPRPLAPQDANRTENIGSAADQDVQITEIKPLKPAASDSGQSAAAAAVREQAESAASKPAAAEPPKVAAAPASAATPTTAPAQTASVDLTKPPEVTTTPEAATAPEIVTAPEITRTKPAAQAVVDAPAVAAATAQPVAPEVSTEAAAASPAEPVKPAAAEVASIAQPTTPATDSAAAASRRTDIVFDVNSSFFPGGAGNVLRKFMSGLADGGQYKVALTGAVGSGDVRGVDSAEALKYNRWMAERRVDRVAKWLESNAGGRKLEISRSYRPNDTSRVVGIEARPAR